MASHICCRSASQVSTSLARGVLVLSRKTKSRTVRSLLGAGVKSFRLTCRTSVKFSRTSGSASGALKRSDIYRPGKWS